MKLKKLNGNERMNALLEIFILNFWKIKFHIVEKKFNMMNQTIHIDSE